MVLFALVWAAFCLGMACFWLVVAHQAWTAALCLLAIPLIFGGRKD